MSHKLDSPLTIEFENAKVKNQLAQMVETLLKDYIVAKRVDIMEYYYPEQSKPSALKVLTPTPCSTKPMGYYGVHKNIAGWHGDIALLLCDKKYGNRAVIFEIKYGWIQITKGEHEFFKKIINTPNDCMTRLNEGKVIIVNGFNFDTKSGVITTKWTPYHKADVKFIDHVKTEV